MRRHRPLKQHLSRLERVVRNMNDWLIVVAFGLAIVDFTAFAALKVPSLASAAASEGPAMDEGQGGDAGFRLPRSPRGSNGATLGQDRWAMPARGALDRSRDAL